MWQNPKPLNLDSIRQSERKVVLGVKCDPELKIRLAQLAEQNELTLSAYAEEILADSFRVNDRLEKLRAENKLLKNKVYFYETDKLIAIYNKHLGKQVTYLDNLGKEQKIKISTIHDVYTIIINSFKY